MSLSKEQILKSDDLTREKINVPRWGGDIWVRTMTGVERDLFETGFIQKNGKADPKKEFANIRARLAVLTICDENGKALFEPEDAEALGKKSGASLNKVFALAQKLNGLNDKDVKELEKNSERGRKGNSGSS